MLFSAAGRGGAMKDCLFLIGLMGCGKTSVGKVLSQKLSIPFLDTDEMIEQQEGRRITQIFAEDGEPNFRDLETKLLHQMTGM